MAVKRAERAKGTETAAEQEGGEEQEEQDHEQERRKRIFDFIDSFRYTGSPSRLSRRGSNASKTSSSSSFVITNTNSNTNSKRDTNTNTNTNTNTGPPSPPSPPVNANVNVIAKKRTRTRTRTLNRSSKVETQVTVAGPETPIAAMAVERRRKTTSKPKSNSNSEPKCRKSSLTAAEKVMEAYQRVPPGFAFTPPPSPHRLLQEDHAFDPWRVLVICMLLNNTTGAQVKKVVDDLFALCPDAQTTLQVDAHLIQHVIRSLGLQNKRARMIKILSQEYLDPDWTHVTSLHGVGKYAADAYAIFCTGKGADVRPDDHKLVDYWNSVYGNGSGLMPHPSTSSVQLCSTGCCCCRSQVPPSCFDPGQPKKQGSSLLLLYKLEQSKEKLVC